MHKADFPLTRDLILIGGGHTHALVLRRWGMNPMPGARLTLVNPEPTAPYSGMLPGHIAGHYTRASLDIDLVRLARFAGARLIVDRAIGLDPESRTVTLANGRRIAFDVASLDIGITSAMPQLEGFAAHAHPAKPLGPFATAWARFLDRDDPAHVAVLGAGVAGAELALAMAFALRDRGRPARVHLIDRGGALSGLPARSTQRLRAAMMQFPISILEKTKTVAVGKDGVTLACGRTIPAGFVAGAAGALPQPWLADTGLDLHDGFVAVGPSLQSSAADVFAVGDCAHMQHDPRPKAGVYAVRQAPVLAHNLRVRLSETGTMRSYAPQSDYLKLISLGGRSALGDRYGLSFSGRAIWRLKDRIDRKFMDQFRILPEMPPPAPPKTHSAGLREIVGSAPLCGGCGAKIGQSALVQALGNASNTPGDDAAAVDLGGARIFISTDHLREMHADPAIMAQLAALHALGDIWAMGATPRAATATVILPRVSPKLAARSLSEIMEAARTVFAAAEAEIVGGHSTQGAELTLGFTVLGTCSGDPVTLAGARAGDEIILTKPIGSGVLMAAEMQGKARGADVVAGLDIMLHGQAEASAILGPVAHAMTDVTGFGLLGHLRNICLNSGVAAELDEATVPFLPGVEALSEQGLRSSLYAENRAALPHLLETPRTALLFDPQTAGGLLAAVPPERNPCDALRAAGYPAVCIGRITEGAGHIVLV